MCYRLSHTPKASAASSKGVQEELDIFGTEDQVREWWPEQAAEHLQLFEERGVTIASDKGIGVQPGEGENNA